MAFRPGVHDRLKLIGGGVRCQPEFLSLRFLSGVIFGIYVLIPHGPVLLIWTTVSSSVKA
jgi:hypothetical protein